MNLTIKDLKDVENAASKEGIEQLISQTIGQGTNKSIGILLFVNDTKASQWKVTNKLNKRGNRYFRLDQKEKAMSYYNSL